MKASMAEAVALFSPIDSLEPALAQAVRLALEELISGGKILVGNGGSACEAQHLAGAPVGRYKLGRRALAAMALNADGATMSCRPRWRSHIAAGRCRAGRAASANEPGSEGSSVAAALPDGWD